MVADAIALFTVWLLVRSSLHKFHHTPAFIASLKSYGFTLHYSLALPLAYAIMLTELLIALMVLIPTTRALGSVGAISLLAIYFALMAWQLYTKKGKMDCGCSEHALTISPALLLRNMVLIALLIPCLNGQSVVLFSSAYFSYVPLLVIFVVSAALILFYLSAELLIANRQSISH